MMHLQLGRASQGRLDLRVTFKELLVRFHLDLEFHLPGTTYLALPPTFDRKGLSRPP